MTTTRRQGCAGKLIGKSKELAHGESKKFTLCHQGREIAALVVNYEDKFFSYLNRCPHLGITLDWADNQFFSVDKRYLMCANHGAVFEPATGECVWGPCQGASLQSLRLDVVDGNLFARYRGENEE